MSDAATEQPVPPDADLDDAALVRAFAGGDAPAMDRLVGRYRRPLFGWLCGMVGDRATAEDLYQDIWLRIIKGAAAFHDISFRAWMWRIARNRVIDFRRKIRPDLTLDTAIGNDPSDESATRLDKVADSRPDPGAQIEDDERLGALRAAVRQLPDIYREVVMLRIQGNMTFQAISDQIGIPLNTVLGRMHDATERLKAMMGTARPKNEKRRQ